MIWHEGDDSIQHAVPAMIREHAQSFRLPGGLLCLLAVELTAGPARFHVGTCINS